MTMLKWRNHSGNACPSCAALDEQVHSEETWKESGLEPKDHALYCQEACSCTMEETTAEENGNLSTVPLRQNRTSALSGRDIRAPLIGAPPVSRRNTKTERTQPMPKTIQPVLRSMPLVERLALPPRAETLAKIESGELDHIDFKAKVFRTDTHIRNPYAFKNDDLEVFATSFEGQPFLRNHDTYDIDARDGTILDSKLTGSVFEQTIRITTRRGMKDFIEGKIDRFSIGWFYDDVLCSICNSSYFQCSHFAGGTYKTDQGERQCILTFVNPKGKETSAVNVPAVEGTGVDESSAQALEQYKLEVIGDSDRRSPHAPRVNSKLLKGVKLMKPDEVTNESVTETQRAALELQGVNETIADLQAKQKQANDMLLAQCRALLDSGLAASKLPAASQKAIRKPFEAQLEAGRPFLATELQTAITEKREELSEISAANTIQGPSRNVYGMINSADQFRLAVADLFGMPREAADANVKVARLSGIREAYLLATGDQEFMGGYHPEFALVTANFPGIVANVMNKMLLQAWKDFEQHYGWWKKITTVEHFTNLNDISWIRTGTIASLPTVAERGEYTELPIGDNKETSTWEKFGGYVPLTIEAVLRDDIRAFKRMPREAALAGIRNISEQIAEIFTTASGAGPTLADTGALFNATAVTTAGGHANLLTTALGTDYTAWNAVAAAVYNQPLQVKNATGYYGTGKKQAIDPSFVLVPRALKNSAEALFVPRWEAQAQNVANVSPSWGGRVEVLTVPEWTDATDWAAAVDPNLVPGIMLGEIFGIQPKIFSASSEIDPAMFANDESRIKVRQFLAVGVADFRGLHKSNVAG